MVAVTTTAELIRQLHHPVTVTNYFGSTIKINPRLWVCKDAYVSVRKSSTSSLFIALFYVSSFIYIVYVMSVRVCLLALIVMVLLVRLSANESPSLLSSPSSPSVRDCTCLIPTDGVYATGPCPTLVCPKRLKGPTVPVVYPVPVVSPTDEYDDHEEEYVPPLPPHLIPPIVKCLSPGGCSGALPSARRRFAPVP